MVFIHSATCWHSQSTGEVLGVKTKCMRIILVLQIFPTVNEGLRKVRPNQSVSGRRHNCVKSRACKEMKGATIIIEKEALGSHS